MTALELSYSTIDAAGLPDARFSSGMPITIDALVAKARCLMPAKTLVGEALPLMSPDQHPPQKLVRLLESDPAAVALVLRTANAPGPRTGDVCTALSISSVRVMSALQAAHALAPPPVQAPYEERIRYWLTATATCAHTIASYLDDTDPDAAYCAAMLSGFGRYVLATSLPVQYAEIVEQGSLRGDPLDILEREWIDFDQYDLILAIAEDFKLPAPLKAALGRKDAASALRASHEKNLLPCVVALAWELEALLRAAFSGRPVKRAKRQLVTRAESLLNLNPSVVEGIIEESRWACFERGEILATESVSG